MKKFFIIKLDSMTITNRESFEAVDMISALSVRDNWSSDSKGLIVLASDVTISHLKQAVETVEKVNASVSPIEHVQLLGVALNDEGNCVTFMNCIHMPSVNFALDPDLPGL